MQIFRVQVIGISEVDVKDHPHFKLNPNYMPMDSWKGEQDNRGAHKLSDLIAKYTSIYT